MILGANQVLRITSQNLNRCYLAIQNLDSTSTNIVYILQQEAEPEVFKNSGFAIGGYGLFEMQNCANVQSKKAWYAYTEVGAGIDLRIVDI